MKLSSKLPVPDVAFIP